MVSELKLGEAWSFKEEDGTDRLIIEDRINTTEVLDIDKGTNEVSINGTPVTTDAYFHGGLG